MFGGDEVAADEEKDSNVNSPQKKNLFTCLPKINFGDHAKDMQAPSNLKRSAHWVIPNVMIVGEYPNQEVIETLIADCGVTLFISLLRSGFDYYPKLYEPDKDMLIDWENDDKDDTDNVKINNVNQLQSQQQNQLQDESKNANDKNDSNKQDSNMQDSNTNDKTEAKKDIHKNVANKNSGDDDNNDDDGGDGDGDEDETKSDDDDGLIILKYAALPMGDFNTTDDKKVIKFINAVCKLFLNENIDKPLAFYVHCQGGHGRTGTIAPLFLMALYGISSTDAIHWVEKCHMFRHPKRICRMPESNNQIKQIQTLEKDMHKIYDTLLALSQVGKLNDKKQNEMKH